MPSGTHRQNLPPDHFEAQPQFLDKDRADTVATSAEFVREIGAIQYRIGPVRWAVIPRGGADLLTVSVSARKGYTLVSLAGEGDVTVRDQLLVALTALAAAGTPHLVVDLSGLRFIDSSCLRVLWRVSRMVEEAGGTLRLAAPQPVVARVMKLWGAGQVIGMHNSVAKAVTSAGG